MRRALVILLSAVLAVSAGATAHVAWHAGKPTSDDARVATQVDFLHAALDDGAGQRMQALFPAGEMFTATLTGMAAANLARRDAARTDGALAEVERALAVVESDHVTAPFGGMAFEHGIFWRGWRLQLLVDRASLSHRKADVAAAAEEAAAVAAHVAAEPGGFPESYPGQRWPCDTVVALSAVARADALRAVPGWEQARAAWLAKARGALVEPGLLPHRVDAAGRPSSGARATSLSIITSFLPDVDASFGSRQYETYREHFLVRRIGLLGAREYPVGTARGAGDVDSGPLLLGVSVSASAVTLAAARRQGDETVWRSLDREAEVLGLPLALPQRRFAFGLVPVGDAFVAWARSVDLGADVMSRDPRAERALAPRLGPWALAAAAPGLAALAGILLLRRRGRAGAAG